MMMSRIRVPWLVLSVIVLGVLSVVMPSNQSLKTNGCFWDRDSLAQETSGFPGITEIITGRFDRFPPLYYEMRLQRVQAELLDTPDALDLYDDAGVASDRIGLHDEAIKWMEKKRAILDDLASDGIDISEHEYRYLANLGTFHIHRWLKSGATRDDLSDVERSHELIKAAIELNPDAHFGRERYQLLAIQWILDGYTHVQSELQQPSIVEAMDGYSGFRGIIKFDDLGYDDAVEGFSGLIALGNAWESIDIFYALSMALRDQEHTSVYLLCQLRIKELIESGKTSLSDEFDHAAYLSDTPHDGYPIYASLMPYPLENISDNYYPKARREADERATRRQRYIQERLAQNIHPDTHPDFWIDWIETTSPPQMPTKMSNSTFLILRLIGLLIIVFGGLFILKKTFGILRKSHPPKPA
jgi:tetratricopeptide (TPR) repeat protein